MLILFNAIFHFFQSFFTLECLIVCFLNYSLCPLSKYYYLSLILWKTEQAKDSGGVQEILGSM